MDRWRLCDVTYSHRFHCSIPITFICKAIGVLGDCEVRLLRALWFTLSAKTALCITRQSIWEVFTCHCWPDMVCLFCTRALLRLHIYFTTIPLTNCHDPPFYLFSAPFWRHALRISLDHQILFCKRLSPSYFVKFLCLDCRRGPPNTTVLSKIFSTFCAVVIIQSRRVDLPILRRLSWTMQTSELLQVHPADSPYGHTLELFPSFRLLKTQSLKRKCANILDKA
jgi:hypothetical protein